jgi:predicted small integral membrane protein
MGGRAQAWLAWAGNYHGFPISHGPLMASGFYVFLITLQVSLLARVSADLMGNWQLRLWAGVQNGIALVLFIIVMMVMVLGGLLRERRSAAKR